MSISIQDDIWNKYFFLTNDKNRDEAEKINLQKAKPAAESNKNFNYYLKNAQKNNESLCKKNGDDSLCASNNVEQKKAVPVVYDYPTNPFMPVDLIADYKADMTTMRINEEVKKSEKSVLNKLIASKL